VEGISAMPWWAPLGGVIGAFAVIAGLLFVSKVGAGAFAGLTITANILMSLVIDHFGLSGVQQHSIGPAVGEVYDVKGLRVFSHNPRTRP
jgi:transporter family-2 protein